MKTAWTGLVKWQVLLWDDELRLSTDMGEYTTERHCEHLLLDQSTFYVPIDFILQCVDIHLIPLFGMAPLPSVMLAVPKSRVSLV